MNQQQIEELERLCGAVLNQHSYSSNPILTIVAGDTEAKLALGTLELLAERQEMQEENGVLRLQKRALTDALEDFTERLRVCTNEEAFLALRKANEQMQEHIKQLEEAVDAAREYLPRIGWGYEGPYMERWYAALKVLEEVGHDQE